MKENILNVSNLLSAFRLFLFIPSIILFNYWNISYTKNIIIIIAILAAISDILDGYFARKFNQITEFGKIIDPLADKVLMGTFLIGMLLNNLLPLYYVLFIISRDLLIFIGGIIIKSKIKKVLPSNFLGKMAVLIIGIVILFRLFGLQTDNFLFKSFYYLSILMIIVSLSSYLLRAIKEYRI